VGAVNERLGEVELAALDEVVGKCLQDALQNLILDPALESSKARRVRRISARHVRPRSPGPKDPEDAIEYVARVAPRSPPPVFSHLWHRKKFLDGCPLLIGEVHLDLRSQTRRTVDLCENTI
jgi:hypothetical protein